MLHWPSWCNTVSRVYTGPGHMSAACSGLRWAGPELVLPVWHATGSNCSMLHLPRASSGPGRLSVLRLLLPVIHGFLPAGVPCVLTSLACCPAGQKHVIVFECWPG